MSKIAVLFAGQGTQCPMMGLDFYQTFEESKQVIDQIESMYYPELKNIIYGQDERLNQTAFTQGAIVATSIAIYEIVKERIKQRVDYFLGFSLGEYSALYASEVLSLSSLFTLIQSRAKWMEEATIKHPGAMGAILGAKESLLEALCQEISKTHGFIHIANYNSPTQHVVSGTRNAYEELASRYTECGAKRVVKLQVSGAFHTPFMAQAAKQIKELLLHLPTNRPQVDIILNSTALPLVYEELPSRLEEHTMGSVKFSQSIEYLIQQGVSTFIEIGPGNVLSGLIKKINMDVKTLSIQNVQDLVKLEELS
ncbi:MAG: ACP S-malonyltransferase [Candidatus Izemoplasmatales bacterium]|nr:ACP S-malonyltransferase [bacterium]MDZ4197508.1 ACP S-malonyltransferase [Candidatus Izemoplasmatales bacterium]